ncbi:MAG: hypothetical protein ACLGGV_01190 [Bacteroidia bacterium]
MKRLTLLLFLVPFLSFSQEKVYTREDSLEYTYLAIKSPIFSAIDPAISTAPIFFEYRYKQKYAIEAGYFFLIPQVIPEVKGKENESLTKFKAEVKRYSNDEFYIGLEYGRLKYQYDFFNDFYTSLIDFETYQYDKATITKSVHIFNVKVGVEYIWKRNHNVVFDIFIGVGARHVDLKYIDVVNRETFVFPFIDGGDIDGISHNANYDITEHKRLRGNMTFGFKLGYKLWSKF